MLYAINFENLYYSTNVFGFRLLLDYLKYRDLLKYLNITEYTAEVRSDLSLEEQYRVLDGIVSGLAVSNGEMALSMNNEVFMDLWNNGIGRDLNFIGHRADFFARRGNYEHAVASLRTLFIGLAKFNGMVCDYEDELAQENGDPSR